MDTLTYPAINLAAIAPTAIATLTAIVVVIVGLFRPDNDRSVIPTISVVGLLVALVASLGFWSQRTTAFGDMVATDPFAGFFGIIIIIAAIIAILLTLSASPAAPASAEDSITSGEYHSLLLFSTAGMLLLTQAADLIIVIIGIELLSLALYVLAGFVRWRSTSLEAALKYFLLGAFAIGFLIYGTALVFGTTGSTKFAGIASALSTTSQASAAGNPMFLIGMALLLIGIGFKLSLVPFHQWTPDVYEGAPTPITAFMSVGTKAAVFAVLLRLVIEAVPQIAPDWRNVLWALAILTMIVGNVAAIVQTSVKRMLAYSSIAQAGYILIGVVAGGRDALAGVLFYLLAYTFMNMGAFAVLQVLAPGVDDDPQLPDLNGLARRAPLAALAMTVFMLSLAGIPPTAGFIAKLSIFDAAVRAGFLDLVIVGVLTSAAATFFYLRVIVNMYMRPAPVPVDGPAEHPVVPIGPVLVAVLVILVVVTLALGIVPGSPLQIAHDTLALTP